MTPRELALALDGLSGRAGHDGFDRSTLGELMQRFPDR